MLKKELIVAKVIDNDDSNHPDDPTKQNRVKIKVEPFMSGWKIEHLPWARPQMVNNGGGSSSHGSSFIPEIDSLIYIYFEDDNMLNPFYISDVSLGELNTAKLFEANVKSEVGSESVYPDVKFKHYKNGINIAVSSNDTTPEISVYHPKSSTVLVDKDGSIFVKTAKSEFHLNAVTGRFNVKNDTVDLKDMLENIQSMLKNLITVGNFVGNLGAPVVYTLAQAELTKVANLSVDIGNLLE